ncbi:aldehyde reductase [Novosphingobium sp. G106]|uniref:SDR family oxidoreductase n=1 Tax=Novosphingobium sp. G106 TaxID=2849500 RepID=UPI001C2D31B2|nr:aldehyde reductase [Novosphingobium sp. G106]MBV1688904.1 aldehyde reductase [Novosphingobium sp. G106]
MKTVTVTGATGFVGIHCIVRLLAEGYNVRATMRSLARSADVEALIARSGIAHRGALQLFEADLNADAGWDKAVEGCEYVLHVASPFPASKPDDPDELIHPAREGTLRVVNAAIAAGAKRVVLTSSVAAVSYGHKVEGRLYDERDWTDLTGSDVDAYTQSKTLAEQAAWDRMAEVRGGTELSVIAPVGIFGPVLGEPLSTSTTLIRHMMMGHIPAVPRIYFGVVDVRDVAELHVKAMLATEAAGQRLIATAGTDRSMLELAAIVGEAFPAYRDRLPQVEIADRDAPEAIAAQIGIRRDCTSEKASRLLGWHPRSTEQAIISTAESILALGLVQ